MIVALLAFLTVLSAPQQRLESETLRPEELFVAHEGLRITLHVPDPTLHIGQDPRFRLDLVNTGRTVLYLSPHVESNLYVTTADGAAVMPAMSGVADRFAPRLIKSADLVTLQPGGTWSVDVHPTRWVDDGYEAYATHGFTKGSGWGLLLPPGRYLARFVYISAPDYGTSYDPYEMPRGLWEGRLASDAVPFTVTAATPEQLVVERRRLGDAKGRPELSLLSVLPLSGAQLVEEFRRNPVSRFDVLRVARLRGERLAAALLEAAGAIPPPDREMIRSSTEFSTLLREQADCTIVRFLIGELRSTRGNAEASMLPVFENAPRCAGVRDQLRAIVADAAALPYARSTGAALLGLFRDPADVALLVELLERAPAGNDDPVPRGAATGLARIGGPLARQALARALGDDRRNYLLGPEFVSRLRTIGGPDAAAPLLAALSAKNDNIIVSALSGIGAAAGDAVAPRLRELIKHRNPTIRSYAAGAIRRIGGTAARDVMRSAVGDRDENVQQQALFYLAEHGDGSDLPAFVTHLTSTNQYVREAASAGIARFGTAATFPQLRQLLQPGGDAGNHVARAIAALTFTGIVPRRTPQQWDEWYAAHRDRSRVEWARAAVDALTVPPLEGGGWQLSAISYLADQGPAAYRQDFERAATSRRPAVRVEAARAIARVDRRRAAALLTREFAGREVRGCEAANRELNQLSGQRRTVVCTDPADRRRAGADWARQQF